MTNASSPWHSLRSYGSSAGPPRSLDAAAVVLRRAGQAPELQLRYRLQGLEGLQLPEPSRAASRRDELWQHTCFEAFVGTPDQQAYWEFNLSPSGDWAVYRFSGYRQGQQQEVCYATLPFDLDPDPRLAVTQLPQPALQALELSCCVQLPPGLAGARQLRIGLTAVLESDLSASNGGCLSYWALAHPGPQADFHDRRGWTLLL